MEVNILLNKRVIDYRDHKVILEDGIEIATRTFIWVSGVTGVTIGNMNPSLIGRGGRIWGSMATVGRNLLQNLVKCRCKAGWLGLCGW